MSVPPGTAPEEAAALAAGLAPALATGLGDARPTSPPVLVPGEGLARAVPRVSRPRKGDVMENPATTTEAIARMPSSRNLRRVGSSGEPPPAACQLPLRGDRSQPERPPERRHAEAPAPAIAAFSASRFASHASSESTPLSPASVSVSQPNAYGRSAP